MAGTIKTGIPWVGPIHGGADSEPRYRVVTTHATEEEWNMAAHPIAPDTPPGNLALGPIAALLDRARDAMHKMAG
jgi:hypothetical protein